MERSGISYRNFFTVITRITEIARSLRKQKLERFRVVDALVESHFFDPQIPWTLGLMGCSDVGVATSAFGVVDAFLRHFVTHVDHPLFVRTRLAFPARFFLVLLTEDSKSSTHQHNPIHFFTGFMGSLGLYSGFQFLEGVLRD